MTVYTLFTFFMPSILLQSSMQTKGLFNFSLNRSHFLLLISLFTHPLSFLDKLHHFLIRRNAKNACNIWDADESQIQTQTQLHFLVCSLCILSLITEFLVLVLSDIKMSPAYAEVDGGSSDLIPMKAGWAPGPQLTQQCCTNLLSYQATYQDSIVQPFVHLRSRSAWIPWQINDSRLLLRERE